MRAAARAIAAVTFLMLRSKRVAICRYRARPGGRSGCRASSSAHGYRRSRPGDRHSAAHGRSRSAQDDRQLFPGVNCFRALPAARIGRQKTDRRNNPVIACRPFLPVRGSTGSWPAMSVKPERVIRLAAGRPSGVGGDSATMEPGLQAAVEIEPKRPVNRFTRRVRHMPRPKIRSRH